jgi:TMEM175 potassium channel family protein
MSTYTSIDFLRQVYGRVINAIAIYGGNDILWDRKGMCMNSERSVSIDKKETNRLEAFSDGVFAVAITLLVLDIKVPDIALDDGKLQETLFNQWPILLAFTTSFFTVGIVWLNHHRLFTYIKRTDTGLLLLNLLLLFIVVFIPVPTALLAKYITLPDQHLAAIVYGGTFFLMACCVNGLWRYASYQNRLFDEDVDQHAVRAINQQYLFGPLLYAVAFGLAWLNSPTSVIFELLLALFFALPGYPLREREQKV